MRRLIRGDVLSSSRPAFGLSLRSPVRASDDASDEGVG